MNVVEDLGYQRAILFLMRHANNQDDDHDHSVLWDAVAHLQEKEGDAV